MSTLKLAIPLILLLIIFTGCDLYEIEDNRFDIITSKDLSLIHNNSSKTWKLEAYYDEHENNLLHSKNDCYTDDTYIFKTYNEVEVIRGGESCHDGNSEIAEGTYLFYAESGTFFFTMFRSRIINDTVRRTFMSLKLIELKENRMVFSTGNKNNYLRALIFVKN
jgi:hypothetical protein